MVTKLVKPSIDRFESIAHPTVKRQVCGADAMATLNRGDCVIGYAVRMGFNPAIDYPDEDGGKKKPAGSGGLKSNSF